MTKYQQVKKASPLFLLATSSIVNSPTPLAEAFVQPTASGTRPHRQIPSRTSDNPRPFSLVPSTASNTRLRAAELVDLSTAFSQIDTFYKTAPFASAFITCGAKASAADFVAQQQQASDEEGEANDGDNASTFQPVVFQSKNGAVELVETQEVEVEDAWTFEPQRNLAFLLYGGLYTGMAQEYIYNFLFPVWFGSGTDPYTVATKVMFDSFVLSPLVCLPIAYLTKALILNFPIQEGLRRYWDDIQNNGLLTTYWTMWIPVQSLTFSIIPEHWRIAFVAMISFFWLILLSTISARKDESA